MRRAICKLAVAAALLNPIASTQAAIVEQHDKPWQIVSYSVIGTTAKPHGEANDIAFEADGDLWLARRDGLFFHDGYTWKRFGIENGLPSNICRAVKVTQAGVLWVGTDRGCGTFDGERFETHGSERGLAGPSVRRISEDPDGTLWFCSDRWPANESTAGLNSLRDGRWRSYGLPDGLPSDQLHGYYRDSEGNQYAVTLKGIARRSGDRWVLLDVPGFPSGGTPYDLFKTPNGELVTTIRISPNLWSVFMTKEGRWQNIGNPASRSLVTRGGQILSTEVDQQKSRVRVVNFKDGQWTPVSAWTRNTRGFAANLVEAPDGAIWGVGKGMFFRWEAGDHEWAQFVGLPRLRTVDSRDQVWFGGARRSWVLRGDRFLTAPGLERGSLLERDGRMWCGHDGALVEISIDSLRIERRHPIAYRRLRQVVMDVDGSVWAWLIHDDQDEIQVFSKGNWKTFPPELHSKGRLRRLGADARGGMLTPLISRPPKNQLRRFTSDLSAREISLPPGTPVIANLWSDRFGIWASGVQGLFHAAAGDETLWSEVEQFHDSQISGIGRGTFQGASYFFIQEPSNGANLAIFDGKDWKTIKNRKGARHLQSSTERDRLYFTIGKNLYLCSEEYESPIRFGRSLLGGFTTQIIDQAKGDIWIVQDGKTLRYRPRQTKPRPLIRLGVANIMSGDATPASVSFSALNRFEPDLDPQTCNYSWRIDEGEWSPFSDAPVGGLSLSNLPIGRHVLQLRVINTAGVRSESVAEAAFVVIPVPLQQREWFRPALAAVGLIFGALSLLLYGATRRLRSQAGKLEAQVQLRTRSLETSEARFRELANMLPEGIIEMDLNLRLTYANWRMLELTGYSAGDIANGIHALDLVAPEDRERARTNNAARLKDQNLGAIEYQALRKDGSTFPAFVHVIPIQQEGEAIGFRGVIVDITGRKQAEEERTKLDRHLRQQQKLESIGTLASGVAHEINNPINGIINFAQLIDDDIDPDSHLRQFSRGIIDESERIAGIVENLLSFARQDKESHSPADIRVIVDKTASLIQTLIRKDRIELRVDVPANLPKLRCRSQQIQQVLMNLLTNARDALNKRYPEGDPDKIISVTTRESAKDGQTWLRTTIEDHGEGIPEKIRDRLFDPFFTTKGRTEGTGLGLSISHGIVQEHHGRLSIESEPGRYTRFHIDLPVDGQL